MKENQQKDFTVFAQLISLEQVKFPWFQCIIAVDKYNIVRNLFYLGRN